MREWLSSVFGFATKAKRSPLEDSPGHDLVRLDNVSLYVPINDNLYTVVVPEGAKNFPLAKHHRLEREATPSSFPPDDVTRLMLTYLDVLARNGTQAHMLDIGAWVGDVAIRWAKHASARGYSFSADCYDPSRAGDLITPNAELNGVASMVSHKPIGVSLSGGPLMFTQLEGHSDSSRLAGISQEAVAAEHFMVPTVPLGECIKNSPRDRHLIVKIDVEGIDAKLVMSSLEDLGDATLIVEFAPHQAQYADISAPDFIRDLLRTHDIYDLYYLPRPTRASPVLDADDFTATIRQRIYGYTDILAVPRSAPAYADITAMIANVRPVEPSYMMA